jgi:pumilio RNA-binding family
VGGTGISGGRNELRFSPGSGRYAAVHSGWRGQRGSESFNDPKIYNFLEELKSGKGRRFELSDIVGNIIEFRQVLTEFAFFVFVSFILKS